jgi:hypothetical protein
MMSIGNSYGRPYPGRPFLFGIALAALLAGLLTATSCSISQAERNGVSPLPVNRPANWEGQAGRTEGDF